MSKFNDTDLKNYGIYLDSNVIYHSFTLVDDGNVINGGNGDKVYALTNTVNGGGTWTTRLGTKVLDRNGNEKVIIGGKWKSTEEVKLCSSTDEVTTNKTETVVLVGNGSDNTSYQCSKSDTGAEQDSDYSFDGAKLVVFKDMKITLGTANYNGFVRPQNLVFDNCVIEGMGHYWGDKTTFNNCKFLLGGADYNIYLYSGNDFTFTNCEFYSSTNRFMNAYREEATTDPIKVSIDGCKFIGAEDAESAPKAKPVVNIKVKTSPTWEITIKNSTLEGALNKKLGFYQTEDGAKEFVSFDGKTVWKNK